MRNEDLIGLHPFDAKFIQSNLSALATIYKIYLVMYGNHLSTRMTSMCRYGRIAPNYRNGKRHDLLVADLTLDLLHKDEICCL